MTRVAVYGSLRQGFGNHPLLYTSRYIGTFKEKLPYTMYDLGAFPALTPNKDDSMNDIVVEVYDVDGNTLYNLDALEGHPRFYKRVKTNIDHHETWIYIMERKFDAMRRVESGDWAKGGHYAYGETTTA